MVGQDFPPPCGTAAKKGGSASHTLIRYWLTPKPDPQLEAKMEAINTLYRQAPVLAAQGERTLSTDELSGVQALERKHPGLPLVPGKVERREFEYIRHGTLTFMINFDVATGQVVTPSSRSSTYRSRLC